MGLDLLYMFLIILLCIGLPMYKRYEPQISIVQVIKHYRVYLWYNKHGDIYCKRVYKFLFEI